MTSIKRYFLEYQVRDKSGNSTPHSESFETMAELDAWLVTTKVGIERCGGEVIGISISERYVKE